MKRRFDGTWLVALLALVFALALAGEAWARAGGSRSSGSAGSRVSSGSRTSSAPPLTSTTRPSTSTQSTQAAPSSSSATGATAGATASRPAAVSTPTAQAAPSSGGFLRGMAGGLAGGFLGSMLFSSFAGAGSHGGAGSYGGSGGGFPFMDIILLAALAYGAYWFFIKRKRQQTQGSNPTSYSSRLDTPAYSPPSPGAAAFDIPSRDTAPPPPPPPPPPPIPGQGQGQDMAQGLAQIQMMDPQFNEALFREQATDIFFQVQSAWTGLKLEPARGVLTPEMFDVLAAQITQMKEQGRVNRLENIAMRGVEMAEAWQEQGYDYITLRVTASLLDYTVDAKGGQVLEGSDSLPVKFEEYWTFARPVGSGPWQVAAITQVN